MLATPRLVSFSTTGYWKHNQMAQMHVINSRYAQIGFLLVRPDIGQSIVKWRKCTSSFSLRPDYFLLARPDIGNTIKWCKRTSSFTLRPDWFPLAWPDIGNTKQMSRNFYLVHTTIQNYNRVTIFSPHTLLKIEVHQN